MKVSFIRHTRVDVAPGTCYGQTDVPLAATFEQEAAEVLRRLNSQFSIHNSQFTTSQFHDFTIFDAVFSSPLSRARRLAAYCGYPLAQTDDRLMEMSMGDWEMKRYDEIKDPYLQRWYDDYQHLPTPGGESFTQLYTRVSSFLDELRERPYHNVAVFAHGGVLVCAGLYGGLYSEDEAWQHAVDYGGMIQVEIN